eukprot:jgi/Botrbrau1/15070/Bobra.0286s0003.1
MSSLWGWACGSDESEIWTGHGFGQCFLDIALLGVFQTFLVVTALAWHLQNALSKRDSCRRHELSQVLKQTGIERWLGLEIVGAAITICTVTSVVLAWELSRKDPEGVVLSPHEVFAGLLGAVAWASVTTAIHYNFRGPRNAIPLIFTTGCSLSALAAATAAASILLAGDIQFKDFLYAASAFLQLMFLGLLFSEHCQRTSCTSNSNPLTTPLLGSTVRHGADFAGPPPGPSTFCSQLFFTWVSPLLQRGSTRQLHQDDMFYLDPDLEPSQCSWVLWDEWTKERAGAARMSVQSEKVYHPSLFWTIARAYGMTYLGLGILKFVGDSLNFAGPLLLNLLLKYLDGAVHWRDLLPHWAERWNDDLLGYTCALLLGVTAVLKAFLNSQYNFALGRLSCQLRSAITCAVFRKAQLVSSVTMTVFSTGAVQTMMSVDADRVVNLASGLHELWSLPLQIAIALYLLYTQVQYAFVAGLAVVLLLIPVNRWLAQRIQRASVGMMAHKDARVRVLGELLRGMYQIKLAVWESRFVAEVEYERAAELHDLATRKYLDALCVYFWAATSLLFSLFTFGLYVLLGHRLTAAVVFTSLALFGVLLAPLNSFPWVVNGVVEAMVSVTRLQGFLAAKELDAHWAYYAKPTIRDRASDGFYHSDSSVSNASTAAAVSTERASGSSAGSIVFPRISRYTSGGSTPVLGILQPYSSQTRSQSMSSIASANVPISAPTNESIEELSAVVDEVINDGNLDFGSQASGKALRPDSAVQGYSSSLGDKHTSTRDPSIILSHASFSWTVKDNVREEAGPSIPPPGSTSVFGPIPAVSQPLHDVMYKPIGWTPYLDTQHTLHDISLALLPGSLTVLVGIVGSGKSSLLEAMLGEMQGCSGRVMVRGSVAYVAQQPWIMSGTVRDNILFGVPFREAQYNLAIRTCCLEPDLAAWAHGDLTHIGDRGTTLSGGQRARLALARAVYQDADVYLLDDVLAAVDSHVAASLVNNVICGPILGGKTRVVVTHSPACKARADNLIRMYAGKIDYVGPPGGDTLSIVDISSLPPIRVRASMGLTNAHQGEHPLGPERTLHHSLSSQSALKQTSKHPSVQSSTVDSQRMGGLATALKLDLNKTSGLQEDVRSRAEIRQDSTNDIVSKISVFASQPNAKESIRSGPSNLQPLPSDDEDTVAVDSDEAHCREDLPGGSEEARQEGHVRWDVYMAYMAATGFLLTTLILTSLILMQASKNANDVFLAYWATLDDYDDQRLTIWPTIKRIGNKILPPALAGVPVLEPTARLLRSHQQLQTVGPLVSHISVQQSPDDTRLYLAILLLIATLNSVFTMLRAFSFAKGGLVAARWLHEMLLWAVIRAPMEFFDKTPTGRILNRFSSDISTTDDALPFTLNIFLAAFANLVGLLIVIGFSQPWMLLGFVPLGMMYRMLQRYYQSSSREVRRLQSITRSPVYATFNEVLEGGACIRAFRQQLFFQQLNEAQVMEMQRSNMAGVAASQWLSLRLQLMAASMVTCIAVLAVLDHTEILPSAASQERRRLGGAGLVGLSLSYALPLTGLLNQLLTTSAETEQEMVAVERIIEYMKVESQKSVLPSLEARNLPQSATEPPSPTWPLSGDLQLHHVSLRYSQDGPWALSGLSLHVKSGEKLGICGRTGAGKSSIISILLRLREIQSGAILLDYKDVRIVPLHRLRDAIGVVPQAPFLFQGTIRDNLDPLHQHSDRELIGILKHVRLWDILCGLALSQNKIISSKTSRPLTQQPCRSPVKVAHSVSMAVPPASPRGRRSPDVSQSVTPASSYHSPSTRPSILSRAVASEAGLADRTPDSSASDFRSSAAEEGRVRRASCHASLSEILPEPALPLSPVSSVAGDNMSLSRVLVGQLAMESTGLLVYSGFGAQLLTTRLGQGGVGLSQGQQQLLCLARVLLKRPVVVCLDECTASVDPSTAVVMQDLIAEQLEQSTVIQVAHRLISVLDCDRVIVMDAGQAAEHGNPHELLQDSNSRFYRMYHAAAEQGEPSDGPAGVADLS